MLNPPDTATHATDRRAAPKTSESQHSISIPSSTGEVSGTAARAVPLALLMARQAAQLWLAEEPLANQSRDEGDQSDV